MNKLIIGIIIGAIAVFIHYRFSETVVFYQPSSDRCYFESSLPSWQLLIKFRLLSEYPVRIISETFGK